MITFERVNELLSYDPETGVLYWKVSPSHIAKAGSEAGTFDKLSGYIRIQIKGKLYQAYRELIFSPK